MSILGSVLSHKHTHIISYDLNYPYNTEIYKALDKKIQSLGYWAKPLNTFWFIKSDLPTEIIKDSLVPIIQNQGKLVVVNTRTGITASYGFFQGELQLRLPIPQPRKLSEILKSK